MDEAVQLSSASAGVVFVPEEAGVIWRMARQLSLHDVLLKALNRPTPLSALRNGPFAGVGNQASPPFGDATRHQRGSSDLSCAADCGPPDDA